MMMYDVCQIHNSISAALNALELFDELGAASMPHCDLGGHMTSPGGRTPLFLERVLSTRPMRLDSKAPWAEVQDLAASSMLYRAEMRNHFSWDYRYTCAFDDTDKSHSIVQNGRWKMPTIPAILSFTSKVPRTSKIDRSSQSDDVLNLV
jgi:hypothetical protein